MKMRVTNMMSFELKCIYYATFEKGGAYCFEHVGQYVGRSIFHALCN